MTITCNLISVYASCFRELTLKYFPFSYHGHIYKLSNQLFRINNMKVSLISLFFLLPALCSGSHHEFTDAISHCNGARTCEIRLKYQTYRISDTLKLSNHSNVTIIGDEVKGSTVCFANRNLTHLLISNVDNVLVRNVHFMGCGNEMEDDNQLTPAEIEFSYFTSANFSFGLSLYSCKHVQILHSNFSDFYGSLLKVIHSKNVSISNSKFEGNKKFYFTQGILYVTPHNEDSTLSISNSSFLRLSADPNNKVYYNPKSLMKDPKYLQGAGAFLLLDNNNRVVVEIERCLFRHCSAVKGGGIFVKLNNSQSSLNFRNSEFIENKAEAKGDIFHVRGGAVSIITLSSGNLEIAIENCSFTGNKAVDGSGGAISKEFYEEHERKLLIQNSTFVKNSADTGGAIAVFGMHLANRTYTSDTPLVDTFMIDSSNISSNQAHYGGAVIAIGISLTLNHSNVFANNFGNFSGGVFMLIYATLAFEGANVIENNRAGVYGGVLYSEFSNIELSLSNHTTNIRDNTAFIRGGAIYVKENSLPLHEMIEVYQSKSRCFFKHTQDKVMHRLVFTNNSIGNSLAHPKSGPDSCFGDDIYIMTVMYCSEKKDMSSSDSQFLNNTIKRFESFGVQLGPQMCSISTGVSKVLFDFEPLCRVTITGSEPHFDCGENLDKDAFEDYKRGITNFLNGTLSLHINSTLNVVFPGYISNITVHLEDEFNQPTSYLVSMSMLPSSADGSSVDIVPRLPNAIETQRVMFISLNDQFKNQILDLCMSTVMHHHHVTNCTQILVSECPRGFDIKQKVCFPNSKDDRIKRIFNHDGKFYGYPDALSVVKPKNMPIIISRDDDNAFVPGECKSFKCACVDKRCEVNLLKPYSQCKEGLTGRYCTNCNGNNTTNKLLIPPVSLLRIFIQNSQCYPCYVPYIWIPIYIICTVLITIFILKLRIDIFNDYTRSIAFYSSILYLYVVSCGSMSVAPLFNMLSGILSVSNLLVTQNLPFCISDNRHKVVHVAIFNNLSPFVYYFYLAVVYFLFQKIPLLQRYNLGKNIHFPMWTLFILTYSNLCVGVFVPLHCNRQRRWIYDESVLCEKTFFTFSSYIVAIIIVPIPIMLTLFSYQSKEKRIHLTENYEQRFRPGFKLWEVMKLLCRFIIAFIFPLPYILPKEYIMIDGCVTVSVICLLLLIVNSLAQPATNHLANHFESFCLLILSLLGIISLSSTKSVATGLLYLSPYALFCLIKLYHPTLKIVAVFSKYLKKREQNI